MIIEEDVMELYHNNMSVCAQKVRLVVREKGLSPVMHHLDLRTGDQTRPDYLALNPKGVVPTLVDGGRAIVESTVICEYLDDAYPDPPLRPKDPLERAAMRQWTLLPDTGLHVACGTISHAIAFRHQYLALGPEELERQLAAKPDPARRDRLRRTIHEGLDAAGVAEALRLYDGVLAAMARRLAKAPWLAGAAYSLADAAMMPYVCRLEDLALSWLWQGERAAIADWLARSKARANYAGIADHLEAKYLDLMGASGREAGPRVAAMLGR